MASSMTRGAWLMGSGWGGCFMTQPVAAMGMSSERIFDLREFLGVERIVYVLLKAALVEAGGVFVSDVGVGGNFVGHRVFEGGVLTRGDGVLLRSGGAGEGGEHCGEERDS